jgi:copper(I)-binding protein
MKPLALMAALGLVLTPAVAAAAASIEAQQPWSRPAAAGGTGAGYVTLVNKGPADALVGAESPIAAKVELHDADMSGGVMRMRPQSRVALPAGAQVSFAPGGRHLMFMGLKKALRRGDRVPATLRFASGAQLKVDFLVTPTPPAASAPGRAAHGH